eukprot:g11333.t1
MNLGSALPFSGCLGRLASHSIVAITNDETGEIHTKLMTALQKKKEEYRTKFKQEMSFTRLLLKLGTVRTFILDIRRVFEERDTDKSGRIDMCEMSAAMKVLKVELSEDEVKALFKMADFYEDKQLTMKQFLVVLAIGYVLDAIPDLLETPQDPEAGAAAHRRMSNFYNKEQTVRNALELFTYAYLLFDKDCKGVISREEVTAVVAENGQKDVGSMNILSQERWDEMDWDSNGDISFGEFVYAFAKWVDVDGEETVEDLEKQREKEQAATDASREGGQARRKSSVRTTGRKPSAMAMASMEITRRISSALSPKPVSAAANEDVGGGIMKKSERKRSSSSSTKSSAAAPATPEAPNKVAPPSPGAKSVAFAEQPPEHKEEAAVEGEVEAAEEIAGA